MSVARYGSWRSPLTAATIARGGVTLSAVAVSGDDIYWSEARPSEGGRTVIVKRGAGDVTPEGLNARTAVHEYGGGAWWVDGDTVFFANWADQRLYRQDGGGEPVAITPEPPIARGDRYADGIVVEVGGVGDIPLQQAIICVRERHVEGREAHNELVILPTDGSVEPDDVISGNDFYSFPRVSPDGKRFAWTEWTHPNLPWDGTFLYTCDLTHEFGIRSATIVAGAMDESIFQPQWSPDGVLHFVSDRSGWWNIYRYVDGDVECVLEMDADFGVPQWVFGQSTYAFRPNGDIVCMYERNARQSLGIIRDGELIDLALPYVVFANVTATRDGVVFIGSSETDGQAIVHLDVESGATEVITRAREDTVDQAYISRAEAIAFPSQGARGGSPTTSGRTAHAFYYAPKNPDFEAPEDEKPPLVVFSHGGPTGAVHPSLNLSIQFWTSRGFAVVDVNYGGSVGYGRDYRRLLNGNWGVVDVEDCVSAARYLVERGDADPDRLAIRGGSAGGFTTLAALVFTDVFKAGANYYGVADFETFVGDTHKFESRYLDSLVGPYPERKDLYVSRSPAKFVDRIDAPVITFQGLEDAIVPPSQSEQIVNALRAKKIPCAYVTYEGEQHGFRKAENVIHSLESELYFYGRVFGFEPADEIDPVPIENM